jgi:glycine cleavage system H protein
VRYPENLLYSKEHEWVSVDGETAVVGITWHAQDALGDVVYVELPAIGSEFKQMEEFGVVESVKTVSNLYCPVSGKVIETNQDLIKRPEIINEDPHVKGWIMKVKMIHREDLKNLLHHDEYETLIQA